MGISTTTVLPILLLLLLLLIIVIIVITTIIILILLLHTIGWIRLGRQDASRLSELHLTLDPRWHLLQQVPQGLRAQWHPVIAGR